MRFQAQKARRIWKHRVRVRRGKPLSLQELEKDLRVPPAKIDIGFTFRGQITEMTPAFDDLLGRAATDSQLQTAVADQIRGAGVFDHVEWILVPHVDDGGADLDAARSRTDGREQRK